MKLEKGSPRNSRWQHPVEEASPDSLDPEMSLPPDREKVIDSACGRRALEGNRAYVLYSTSVLLVLVLPDYDNGSSHPQAAGVSDLSLH
jgi:hypothetical protein